MAVRVLLAEDHRVLRDALRRILSRESEVQVVADAEDGEAAVRQVEQTHPDVVLMDLDMPRMGGIEATRRIREISPGTKVLMVSCHGERECIEEAARAGASGYVLKDRAASDLPSALRRIVAGGVFFGPGVADEDRTVRPVLSLVRDILAPPAAPLSERA